MSSKFQVLDRAFVIRRQFPISSAYAITVHKSQGLTLKNVLADIGNNIFACGQAYVAMSRVTSLSGLHLINFDPRSIKALDSAVLEYNYLRKKFRPSLSLLTSHKKRPKVIADRQWCTKKYATLIQQQSANRSGDHSTPLPNKGFRDSDGCSGYANSVMQCLLHSKTIRQACSSDSSDCLKQLISNYEGGADTVLDCMDIRAELGSPFDQRDQQDPVTYLEALVTRYPSLSSLLQHSISVELQCDVCNILSVSTKEEVVMSVAIPEDSKTLNMNDLIVASQQYVQKDTHVCEECNVPMKLRTQIVDAKKIIVLKLDVWNKALDGAKMVRRKANITSAQNSSIKVGDRLFTLQSSVHLLSDKGAGFSYISIVRSNSKWIHCNNQVLSRECWPKGAKNLYLAFYGQTPLCGTKQHKFDPEALHAKFTPLNTTTAKGKSTSKQKLPQSGERDKGFCSKKVHVTSASSVPHSEDWGGITSVELPRVLQTEWPDYRYFPIDEEWQRQTCRLLNLRFVRPFERESGGPDVILTRPDTFRIRRIYGDGNCLFRAMSFIITGSESQHFEIRTSIIAHMLRIPELLTGRGVDGHNNYLSYYHGGYHSVENYLVRTNMADDGTWGTDLEMSLLAHMLDIVVYSYKAGQLWIACFPKGIDHSLPEDVNKKSIYIYYTGNHYNVVTKVLPRL